MESLKTVSIADTGLAAEQRLAVQTALARRGVQENADSPFVLTASLSERPADMGLRQADGEVITLPKNKRLLQNCADRMFRLVLGVIDRRTGAIVGRGWAEEAHCHGEMAGALPRLSRDAVAGLIEARSRQARSYWRAD